MGVARLYAVGSVVGQAQADGPGGGDGAVVGEARAHLGQLGHQLRRVFGDALHVAGVAGVEDASGHLVADLVAIVLHLRALAQHGRGHLVVPDQRRRRTFLPGQFQRYLPAGQGHFPRHLLGEHAGLGAAVAQPQQGQGRAQTEKTHAMAALAEDLFALPLQRQAVDLHHVVEHAGEHPHHGAEALPVEMGVLAERLFDEGGQVDRAEQAGAIGWQRLFATVVGMQAIAVEGVDAGNACIEDRLFPEPLQGFHRGDEALTVQGTLVAGERRRKPLRLAPVGKADQLGIARQGLAADHQFVLGPGGIERQAATAIGQTALSGRPPLAVEGGKDAQTLQHALHHLQARQVGLRQAN
ncbi:hypothetical protein D3C84_288530 [compost metagenome]